MVVYVAVGVVEELKFLFADEDVCYVFGDEFEWGDFAGGEAVCDFEDIGVAVFFAFGVGES